MASNYVARWMMSEAECYTAVVDIYSEWEPKVFPEGVYVQLGGLMFAELDTLRTFHRVSFCSWLNLVYFWVKWLVC